MSHHYRVLLTYSSIKRYVLLIKVESENHLSLSCTTKTSYTTHTLWLAVAKDRSFYEAVSELAINLSRMLFRRTAMTMSDSQVNIEQDIHIKTPPAYIHNANQLIYSQPTNYSPTPFNQHSKLPFSPKSHSSLIKITKVFSPTH